MAFFSVDILTPSSVVARNIPADSLLIPTIKGQINVLAEHTHFVTKLGLGVLTLRGGAQERNFSVTTGVCKVLKNKVTILSLATEENIDIDVERAKKTLKFAQDKLASGEVLTEYEIEKYRRKIERAQLRIQLVEKEKNS